MTTILIIDDEEIIRNRLKRLLELEDYVVFAAENGSMGLQQFEQINPNIVLLDVHMPGMNGIEVLGKIKEKDTSTEVILITGHGGVSTAIKAMRKGAFGYIQKPIDFDELEIDIKRALEKQALQKALDDHIGYLKNSEERFRALVQTAGDAIITIDSTGSIVFWNKAAETIFGYTGTEIIGKALTTIIPDKYVAKHVQGISKAVKRVSYHFSDKMVEIEGLHKDGKVFPIELSLAMFKTSDNQIFFTGVLRNITERKIAEKKLYQYSHHLEEMVTKRTHALQNALDDLKKAQNQMIHIEKMASIGQLAAGVAHEINNPATFVNVNINTLEKWCNIFNPLITGALEAGLVEEDKRHKLNHIRNKVPDVVKAIKNGVLRISAITSALRSFARTDEQQKQMIDVCEAIANAEMITKNQYKYHATLTIEKKTNIPKIIGNVQQLEQVFMNLIVNSAHAITERNLRWPSDQIPAGHIKITLSVSEMNPKHIEIRFKDNGIGISADIQKKIFDPFFTTKPQEKGTGLGLSIVYGIISDHNGHISVESKPNEGTLFLIKLPVEN